MRVETRTFLVAVLPCGCADAIMTVADAEDGSRAGHRDIADFYKSIQKREKRRKVTLEVRTVERKYPDEMKTYMSGCNKCRPNKVDLFPEPPQ